jgi:hypothetical protein
MSETELLQSEIALLRERVAEGEQLVGEGIGLVDKLTDALRHILDTGDWVYSQADGKSVFVVYLAESTHTEFINLLEAV